MFGIAGWKWLFLVVSLPCVLIGVAVLVLLADRPALATWLTPAERVAVETALALEAREKPRSHLADALRDRRVWLLAAIQFGFTLGSYGIGIWLPLILKENQLSTLQVGWLSAVPYVFASVAMMAWAWAVDRSGRRIFNLVVSCGVGTLGLGGALLVGGLWPVLAGLTVALIGGDVGAGGVLDDPDAVPDRGGGGGRVGVHQHDRDGGRVRRTLHDGRVEAVDRVVRGGDRRDGGGHAGRDGPGRVALGA